MDNLVYNNHEWELSFAWLPQKSIEPGKFIWLRNAYRRKHLQNQEEYVCYWLTPEEFATLHMNLSYAEWLVPIAKELAKLDNNARQNKAHSGNESEKVLEYESYLPEAAVLHNFIGCGRGVECKARGCGKWKCADSPAVRFPLVTQDAQEMGIKDSISHSNNSHSVNSIIRRLLHAFGLR
jgi:hypothetical protein